MSDHAQHDAFRPVTSHDPAWLEAGREALEDEDRRVAGQAARGGRKGPQRRSGKMPQLS